MAGNIKGITIEIGGDTKPLQNALKDVNKESRSTQKELKEIDKALKFDPSNITLLSQKQEVLAKHIATTKSKLEVLKKAQSEVEAEFKKGNIGAEEYRAFKRQIEITSNVLTSYEDKLKEVNVALDGNASKIDTVSRSMSGMQDETNKLLKADVMVNIADKAGQLGQKMIGLGKDTLNAFKEVDSGLDIITTKTGASGKALEEMQSIASDLAVSIPTDFNTAGNAVGELNTQFGLTGDKLKSASELVIKFADINGSDVTSATITAKQAIEAYGLTADDLGNVLDNVTYTSQQTGVSVDDLMSKAVQGAPQIKALGLSFSEGTTLLGQFEKEGVDSSAVLSSLSKASVNYAKDGKTLQAGLTETIKQIKSSTNETEALSIASEVFGTKAAPRMVDAIKRGTFNMDELSKTAQNASGAVSKTFENTQDPIDKFTTAQNASKQAMAEIGNEIATALAPALEQLAELIKGVATWFKNLSPEMKQGVIILGLVTTAILTILPVIGALTVAMGALNLSLGVVGGIIGGIVLAIIAVIAIIQNWGAITSWLGGVWDSIVAVGQALWQGFLDFMIGLWQSITDTISNVWTGITSFLGSIWNGIVGTATGIFNGIMSVISGVMNGISGTISGIWNGISSFLSGLWNGIIGTASSVFNSLSGTISGIMNGISGTVSSVWNGIKSSISGAINGAKNAVSSAINAIKGFFNFKISWPKIPLPHFSISGSANPLDWISKGVPKISIDWYAKGGILTKPTAFGMNGNSIMAGGEAGREAVLPLNKETLGMIGQGIAESSGFANNNIENLLVSLVDLTKQLLDKETDIQLSEDSIVDKTYKKMSKRINKASEIDRLMLGGFI